MHLELPCGPGAPPWTVFTYPSVAERTSHRSRLMSVFLKARCQLETVDHLKGAWASSTTFCQKERASPSFAQMDSGHNRQLFATSGLKLITTMRSGHRSEAARSARAPSRLTSVLFSLRVSRSGRLQVGAASSYWVRRSISPIEDDSHHRESSR